MKINVTVDVSEIFESNMEAAYEDGMNESESSSGMDLKEEIQLRIINGVKNSISKDCLELVEKRATSEIDKAINESIGLAKQAIESKALQFAEDWLEKEVTITDKWGDAQDCLTITDLIKRSFDNLLEKKVDNRGRFDSGFNGMPLYKYLTENRVQEVVEEKMQVINKDIESAISEAVNKGIRKTVSDKFAEMVIQTAKDQNAQLPNKVN